MVLYTLARHNRDTQPNLFIHIAIKESMLPMIAVWIRNENPLIIPIDSAESDYIAFIASIECILNCI